MRIDATKRIVKKLMKPVTLDTIDVEVVFVYSLETVQCCPINLWNLMLLKFWKFGSIEKVSWKFL